MIALGTYMVIVSCPAAGTQPTAGNWSRPRAQRKEDCEILCGLCTFTYGSGNAMPALFDCAGCSFLMHLHSS